MINIKLYGIRPEFRKRTNLVLFIVSSIVEENFEDIADQLVLSVKVIKDKTETYHSFVSKKMKEIIDEKMYFDVTNNQEYLESINYFNIIQRNNFGKLLSSASLMRLLNMTFDYSEELKKVGIATLLMNALLTKEPRKFKFFIDEYGRVKVKMPFKLSLDISSFNPETHFIKINNREISTYNHEAKELTGYKKVFNEDYQRFIKNISPERLLEKAISDVKEIRKQGLYNVDLSNFLIINLYTDLKRGIETSKEELD